MDNLSMEELFIRFAVRGFSRTVVILRMQFFPGRIWDLIVLLTDHHLFFVLFKLALSFIADRSKAVYNNFVGRRAGL